jgi:nucleotidyltransferase/DNA polymerase involved in DNA repair
MTARLESDRRLTEEILGLLHKWGIHTLGQLAALDKEELRARLGPEAVQLWERANGTATRLLKFVQPPETFDESFEFDHEIETAEPLLFMLRRFLEQLALRLSAIYLVTRELTLRISFSNSPQDGSAAVATATRTDKQSYERVFKIPQPTNDVDLLFRMLQTHLENFKSEHPIVAVALTAQPIRPASQQFGLFETALRNPHQLYEMLARLSALLGNDRVGTPIKEETHRPDAFRMEPFAWALAADSEPEWRFAATTPQKSRVALRRFRPPARTSIFVSEHKHLEGEKIRGRVVDQAGPFLLSGNWWDEKSWARAEYDMQLENGDLVRAHEDPPSQSASPAWTYGVTGGTWKIDGIYD